MNKLECEMSRVEMKLSPKCKAAIKVILNDCMPDCGCEKCMAVGILLDELLRPTPKHLQKQLDKDGNIVDTKPRLPQYMKVD